MKYAISYNIVDNNPTIVIIDDATSPTDAIIKGIWQICVTNDPDITDEITSMWYKTLEEYVNMSADEIIDGINDFDSYIGYIEIPSSPKRYAVSYYNYNDEENLKTIIIEAPSFEEAVLIGVYNIRNNAQDGNYYNDEFLTMVKQDPYYSENIIEILQEAEMQVSCVEIT
jgi:hypothetical protein